MRIGIFFGGPSREREISFAGGRTVYDNLDKVLFAPVPVFVDSAGNFILLNWQYIYKGSIRDFYPPVEFLPASLHSFQIYIESLGKLDEEESDKIISKVGKKILPHEFKKYFDFAFLALHGRFGEDGQVQGLLESEGIPYSGSGILPSAIGMNKVAQKQLMITAGFNSPKWMSIKRDDFINSIDSGVSIHKKILDRVGMPYVVKPANQGSSVGASVVNSNDINSFYKTGEQALFTRWLEREFWIILNDEEKVRYVRDLCDIRTEVGIPVIINQKTIYNPKELITFIDSYFVSNEDGIVIEAVDGEPEILIEEFIDGKEFSCIIIQNSDGKPVALPPTEIVKGKELFDYRAKYLAGLSRKVMPINIPDEQIESIRKECERLFNYFGFNVYARIDGFISKEGKIILNDPNTTSGMLPSSFFFHQAAEIGLNPSQFLTYIIHQSLKERIRTGADNFNYRLLLNDLDKKLDELQKRASKKIQIAVVLGGYSSERHISVESGRNIYEKLASSDKYQPFPVFLIGNDEHFELYQIPINILLKDNADDIREKVLHFKRHNVIEKIKQQCAAITGRFATKGYSFEPEKISFAGLKQMADGVFIALHGRPGEDGAFQRKLEKIDLPYNGSGVVSSQITIDKYATNELLRKNGFKVASHLQVFKKDWINNANTFYKEITEQFKFPFIAKPVDDGCSSAVKLIKNENELKAFTEQMFRSEEALLPDAAQALHLKPKEEFPRKTSFLIETLVNKGEAVHFLEITGGLLTHLDENGAIIYELFEPSETLAEGEVLSLEEKFLAGEGQNITPARFSADSKEYRRISEKVKTDLKNVAQLLNIEGYCRIDAFVRIYKNGDVETIIIEVNSLPGMTPATCIFHQAAINQYKPYDFIDKILEFSFKKHALQTA
jgi:UDP-N-acetylmuramate--alanine ligase